MALPNHMIDELKKLVWTATQMKGIGSIHPYSMRIQGKHPITGGTSVVYNRREVRTVSELQNVLCNLLFGQSDDRKTDFIRRVNKKVVGAYACNLSISGYDADGDSLEYEVKFENQEQMLSFVEHGAIALGSNTPSMQTLLEY